MRIKDKRIHMQKKNACKSKFSSSAFLLLLFSSSFLTGCASFNLNTIFGETKSTTESVENLNSQVPAGIEAVSFDDFVKPDIPNDLQGEALKPLFAFELLPYVVIFTTKDNQELLDVMYEKSILLSLQSQIPTDELTFDKRIIQDEQEAIKIMHSLGYYSAKVESIVDKNTFPIQIKINLLPNEQYALTKSDIFYPESFLENLPDLPAYQKGNLPKNLFKFQLEENSPAESDAILTAIDRITPWLNNRGYPFAKIDEAKFYAIEETKEFEAEIKVNPAEYKVFGDIELSGTDVLDKEYVERIKTWEYGDAWNSRKLLDLQSELLGIGVFSFANVRPATNTEGEEQLDVLISLTEGKPRSWGGGINYDTIRGVGGNFFWEHRNLFGSAEYLKLDALVWQDLQEARALFVKPDVYMKHLDFNGIFTFKSEVTDAYDTTSGRLDLGFEFPLQVKRVDNIWLSAYGRVEVGIEENNSLAGKQEYYYFGLPLEFRQRNTDSIFDPSLGYNFILSVAPYMGKYKENFSLISSEVSLSTYFPLLPEKKLILATRFKAGSLYPQDAENIPSSLRFFAGGGNSVRGYGYQELGPEDEFGDPIGGASFVEASVELRYKVTDDIAIVPFFDAGNVYSTAYPTYPLDLKFGAGLGLRYFTPVGPLRFDLAFPLSDDHSFEFSKFQIYISIGQSF